MVWRDGHLSGKFEATLAQWNDMASEYTGSLNTDVFAMTEAGGVKRLALPKGFGQYSPSHAPGADCLIAWDGDTFRQRPVAKGVEVISERDWGARKGVGLHWVLLRHLDTDGTLLRWAMHWPAHVQQGDYLRRGKKVPARDRSAVLAWQETEKRTPEVIGDLIAKYDPDATVGSSDFNVDLLRAAWRKRINAAFCDVHQHVLPPEEGTLGKRGIDGFLTDATRRRRIAGRKGRRPVHVFDTPRPFDHDGLFVDLTAAVA